MMAGAAGIGKAQMAVSSFGNCVFWDYGLIPEFDINGGVDLYLCGNDGL
jgi:hypothetical protein